MDISLHGKEGRQKRDVFSSLGGKTQLTSCCNKLHNTDSRNIFRLKWKVQAVQVSQYSVPLPSWRRGHNATRSLYSTHSPCWLAGCWGGNTTQQGGGWKHPTPCLPLPPNETQKAVPRFWEVKGGMLSKVMHSKLQNKYPKICKDFNIAWLYKW